MARADDLRTALLRASPARRVFALTPVLAAADAALTELGYGRAAGHGRKTAALVAARERGETLAPERVAYVLQSTALTERTLGQGDLEASMALQWVVLGQAALADALGLDMHDLLTRATRAPEDGEAEPTVLFDAGDLELPPDMFAALLDVVLDELSPPAPAVADALAEVARRLA